MQYEICSCCGKPKRSKVEKRFKKPIDSITATGAGTINIEAGRIGTSGARNNGSNPDEEGYSSNEVFGKFKAMQKCDYNTGRWPSNFLLDEESAILLGAQSGNRTSGAIKAGQSSGTNYQQSHRKTAQYDVQASTGTAARFFFQSNWQAEEHDPFFYCAKAGRVERDAGLEEFPLIASEKIQQRKNNGSGELLNGTGTVAPLRNIHPTVKPVRLTKYLASLLSPPPEYAPRRILVPFSGSSSEMIGCVLSGGWELVQGIEMNTEYVRIAESRIKFWQMNSGLFDSLMEDEDDAPTDAQETLF